MRYLVSYLVHLKNHYNLNIEKSYRGSVGCISAKPKDYIGKFTDNTDFGIKGDIVKFDTSNYEKYKVASLNEVKTGNAQIILQTSNEGSKKFDIEILNIENQKTPKSKTFNSPDFVINILSGVISL